MVQNAEILTQWEQLGASECTLKLLRKRKKLEKIDAEIRHIQKGNANSPLLDFCLSLLVLGSCVTSCVSTEHEDFSFLCHKQTFLMA